MSDETTHYIFVTVRTVDFTVRYIMYSDLSAIGDDFKWVPAMLESGISYPSTNVFSRLQSEGWELLPNTTSGSLGELVYHRGEEYLLAPATRQKTLQK